MSEKERYDLESRISAARCELEDAKKNIAELHEIMERQAESNARLIAESIKKDEEIGRLQEEMHEAKSELAKYREAEQDGRMAVLPVKKGTKIFRVVDIPEHKCQGRMRGHYFPSTKRIYKGVMQWEDGSDFGKTVFLTREEAEAALALKGGED